MTVYEALQVRLAQQPSTWLVTGVAGFIGSNLLETLLKLGQRVVGLDNFSTGHQRNLDEVQALVTPSQWLNFHFIQGDICKLSDCRHAMCFPLKNESLEFTHSTCLSSNIPVDYVLHQAALGSVPRSIEDPVATNEANVTGFLNMLVAARDAKVKRFVYAASSSTYGDHPGLPKVEDIIGMPLSPYAVTKYVNELYAKVFARNYGLESIGLRYFNVFGPRQDPEGAYAAVIPKWIASMIQGASVYINGDGETSRDFCFITNVVQANLLAATVSDSSSSVDGDSKEDPSSTVNQVYNVAVGERTSLNDLYVELHRNLLSVYPHLQGIEPRYRDFRAGDVRHSLADVGKAVSRLGYEPTHRVEEGLALAMPWYVRHV